MFDSVVSLLGEVLACGAPTPAHNDPGADAVPTAGAPASAELDAADLVDRIAATEHLMHAAAAAQARDLHALTQARLASDRDRVGVGARLAGRSTAFEVALAVGVSPQAATSRLLAAGRLVRDHPTLLALADAGAVSAWALRLVLRHTDVLDPDQRQAVDTQLAPTSPTSMG